MIDARRTTATGASVAVVAMAIIRWVIMKQMTKIVTVNHVFVLKDFMEIRHSAKQSRSPTPFIWERGAFLNCVHWFPLASADVPCARSLFVWLVLSFRPTRRRPGQAEWARQAQQQRTPLAALFRRVAFSSERAGAAKEHSIPERRVKSRRDWP